MRQVLSSCHGTGEQGKPAGNRIPSDHGRDGKAESQQNAATAFPVAKDFSQGERTFGFASDIRLS